jgi:carboxypeptidase Taq
MFTADHLVRRVTGHSLTPDPWLAYAEQKYRELYQLGGR